MAGIGKVHSANTAVQAPGLQLEKNLRNVVHNFAFTVRCLQGLANHQGTGIDSVYGDQSFQFVFICLTENFAIMINRPHFFPKYNICKCLAFRHGNNNSVWQASFYGDLVNVWKLRKNTAQRGKTIKEEQVVAFFDINGADNLLIRIVHVSVNLYVGYTEKHAHHKYNCYNHKEEDNRSAEAFQHVSHTEMQILFSPVFLNSYPFCHGCSFPFTAEPALLSGPLLCCPKQRIC